MLQASRSLGPGILLVVPKFLPTRSARIEVGDGCHRDRADRPVSDGGSKDRNQARVDNQTPDRRASRRPQPSQAAGVPDDGPDGPRRPELPPRGASARAERRCGQTRSARFRRWFDPIAHDGPRVRHDQSSVECRVSPALHTRGNRCASSLVGLRDGAAHHLERGLGRFKHPRSRNPSPNSVRILPPYGQDARLGYHKTDVLASGAVSGKPHGIRSALVTTAIAVLVASCGSSARAPLSSGGRIRRSHHAVCDRPEPHPKQGPGGRRRSQSLAGKRSHRRQLGVRAMVGCLHRGDHDLAEDPVGLADAGLQRAARAGADLWQHDHAEPGRLVTRQELGL